MKKKSSNLVFFIIMIIISIFLLSSKPFIDYNIKDYKIYKNIMRLISLSLIIISIINITKTKKKNVLRIIIILLCSMFSIMLYTGHSNDYKINSKLYFKSQFENNEKISTNTVFNIEDNNTILEKDKLRINYIDVGQGDSIFIELPNSESMLIDAGEKNQKDKVIGYIKSRKYTKIDYVVGTHPHTDHIGAMSEVIKEFDIGNIYMPKKSSNSNTFLNLLNTIKEKGLKIKTAKSGVVIKKDSDLNIKIIAPVKEYNNTNNSSAVVKLTYKNNCFLFMGDAEVDSENDITENLECDVVKIGHHGSDTSSSQNFVNKTKAKYAIISVGANNIYQHPYDIIIKRWKKAGAKVLRTDKLKDIILESDGNNISINNDINQDLEDDKTNIELIDVSAFVGAMGNIKIKGVPNTTYSIQVYVSSGVSKSKTLTPKQSDNDGYIEWNWKINSNTKVGTYKIIIKSNDEQAEFEYEIK